MLPNIVYALIDPRDGQIRYVGQSGRGLRRPQSHWWPSRLLTERTHTNSWVKSVVAEGLVPLIQILQEVEPSADLDQIEIDYIAACRREGYQLTNHTNGGRAARGYKIKGEALERSRMGAAKRVGKPKHSEAFKAALAERNRNRVWTEESKNKVSATKTGKPGHPMSEANKALLRAANVGRPRSPETIEKIRAAALKRPGRPCSAEHKAKISAARLGRKFPRKRPDTI